MSSALAGHKLAVWPEESHFNLFGPKFSHLYNEEIGLENLSSIKVPSNSEIPYVWKCFKRSPTPALGGSTFSNSCLPRLVWAPIHPSVWLLLCRWLWWRRWFKIWWKSKQSKLQTARAALQSLKRQEFPVVQTQPRRLRALGQREWCLQSLTSGEPLP